MQSNGCKTCPVEKCTTLHYRGSVCAALRSAAGIETDPDDDECTVSQNIILDMSTAHLTQEAERYLSNMCYDKHNPTKWLEVRGFLDGTVTYPKLLDEIVGYFVYISEEINIEELRADDSVPVSLVDCIEFAINHGARWVNIDRDAPYCPGLARYDCEWEAL